MASKRNSVIPLQRLEAEARALGKRLDALIVQARKAETGARSSAMRQMRMLQQRQRQAARALAKLGRQSAAAGEPMVIGLQKAWRDIELAVRQGAKRFRDTA
ncbi:MAG TPA: hypothetical protein VEX61_13470 [Burkholderiales bacterium]|nr:hypothetical protein [Burkholderiales bacterium]